MKDKDLSGSNTGFIDKVFYKMKNVYITLGKKNLNKPSHKNNLSPSMMKKKILQTQSNNQSYLTTVQIIKNILLYTCKIK